uniref:Uncharacterized protein n=1 Tax=Rhizophora mucronata TaxID=61149 RepID=A0A2P2Q784_RHIMU
MARSPPVLVYSSPSLEV